ncbi:AMP-binding protein [Olivibacter jilunii]|uniref:AMP-binding protein n=1 Tax=Olivibacter jilunii TaxID=985016 RepID=UPI003F5CE303
MNEENTLYRLIEENSSLQYLNTVGNRFTVQDLTVELPFSESSTLVFLYLDNTIRSVSILLSCLKGKAVLALLDAKLNPLFKKQLEQQYKPAFVYDAASDPREHYVPILCENGITLFQRSELSKISLHPRLRMLLTTSGSTGSPKFVKLSESNLIENAHAILAYLPIQHGDVTPLNLPIHYSYGLSVFTTNSIKGGSIVCGCSDMMQHEFWAEWAQFQYTNLAGVPYVYETLLRLKFLERKHPGLRYLTQAGGKLNDQVLRKFAYYAKENGIEYYVMYGQTEATARMSYLPADRLLDKTGSIGWPIKSGSFKIDSNTGELLYTGPNVFGGYACGPQDLASFEQINWLSTGDLATQDEDGFFYITGRSKRIVKLFGTRINLDELEQLLKNHFADFDFVCLGVEDKSLCICTSAPLDKQQAVKELLHQQVHIHQKIVKICSSDTVARTANGKIDYKTTADAIGLLP